MMDASGVHALRELYLRCHARGTHLILSGLQAQPRRTLSRMALHAEAGDLHVVPDFDAAIELAESLPAREPSHEH